RWPAVSSRASRFLPAEGPSPFPVPGRPARLPSAPRPPPPPGLSPIAPYLSFAPWGPLLSCGSDSFIVQERDCAIILIENYPPSFPRRRGPVPDRRTGTPAAPTGSAARRG